MLLHFPCTLNMQETDYPEILVYTNQTTWFQIPGICNPVIPYYKSKYSSQNLQHKNSDNPKCCFPNHIFKDLCAKLAQDIFVSYKMLKV